MKIVYMSGAWEDYVYWQMNDQSTLKKINALIKESMQTPFEGTGKPEALKENLK